MNTPTDTPEKDPIEVGSFFLETLTTGMYEDPFHCIREYVQNGYDAINDAIRAGILKEGEGRVLISVGGTAKNPSLGIHDNGIGVVRSRAYSTLVSLGASRKLPTQHAGFRGIGRLAGIAYCTTLRFTTKAKGDLQGTIVEYDCGRIRGFLKPGAEPQDVRHVVRTSVKERVFDAAADEHYTEVEMINLTSLGLEFVEMDKLHPYLRQVCPVNYADNFDYAERIRALASGYGDSIGIIDVETRMKRERVSIHKPYKNSAAVGGTKRASTSTLYDIETFTSKEHGWYGWIGKSNFVGEITDDTVAGARFRVKNIQIGDSRLIEDLAEELTPVGTERRLQRWAVGEIFITNTQVVPNARRDGFEDNQAWRDIRKDIKEKVVKRVIKLIRSASDARAHLKKSTNAYSDLSAKVNASNLTSAEKTKLAALIKRQIDLLGSEKVLAGADPKEISSLLSRYKELQEQLAKRSVDDPQTTQPQPPPDGEDAADTESEADEETDSTTGEDNGEQSGGQKRPDFLDVVSDVLTQELGEVEAERLMTVIRARLAG
jgi:histidine kinase/DNA gyrase B/HSP90-like ATPase